MKNKKNNGKVGVRVDLDKDKLKYAKRANEELGIIQFKGSRDIDMCEVMFETDNKTFDKVAEIGRDLIKTDKHKLFGYAIIRAIEEVMADEARERRGGPCSKA